MREMMKKNQNSGFSLVELIVVIAIMAVMTGVISFSVSLLIGSEAKAGSSKLSAQFDEVKTGSMSRMNEDLTLIYVDDTTHDWADKKGYYVIKRMYTLTEDADGKSDTSNPDLVGTTKKKELGTEHRYICGNKAEFTVVYTDGSTSTLGTSGTGFTFTVNRADGTYGPVTEGTVIDGDTITEGSDVKTVPSKIEIKSGVRTYTINILSTGKHTITRD